MIRRPLHLAMHGTQHTPTRMMFLWLIAVLLLPARTGETAFHLACRRGDEPLASMLVEHSVNLDARDRDGIMLVPRQCPIC
jgi:ankyrin repeat protein